MVLVGLRSRARRKQINIRGHRHRHQLLLREWSGVGGCGQGLLGGADETINGGAREGREIALRCSGLAWRWGLMRGPRFRAVGMRSVEVRMLLSWLIEGCSLVVIADEVGSSVARVG